MPIKKTITKTVKTSPKLTKEVSMKVSGGKIKTTIQKTSTLQTKVTSTVVQNKMETNVIQMKVKPQYIQHSIKMGFGYSGLSAYQIWLNEGNTGTEQDFLDFLRADATAIIDNLVSQDTDKGLSANQGYILKGYIDAINTLLTSDDTTLDELQEIVEYIKLNRESLENLDIGAIAGLGDALSGKQATLQSGVNIKTLNGNSLLGGGNLSLPVPQGESGNLQRSNGASDFTADEFLNFDATTGEMRSFLSLGSEKILNGSFTGTANNWTLPTGFTYASNRVGHTANGTSSMTQNTNIVIGKFHKITFDIQDLTVGSVSVSIGGVALATISANGSYTYRFRAINTNSLAFSPTNTSRFYIDNVSLKEYSGGAISTGKGYFNDKVVVSLNGSNVVPGTIDHLEIENPSGGYSHIPFKFGTSQKASLGATSGGELQLRSTGGGNTFGFYSGSGTLSSTYLIAYLTQSSFTHYGHGLFGGRVSINSASTPLSFLNSGGSFGRKTKIITSSPYTPDVYDDILYVDTTTASGCSGTPSASCASWTNQTDCEKWDAHGGCSWSGGDCSAFNGDQFSCESNSGCTWSTADCSGVGAYDQSSCESYSGCSWSNSGGDCSGFGDEMTCVGYMGCSWNAEGTSDCSSFSGDQMTCEGNPGCSWDYMDGYTCSGSYVSSPAYCSGTYDNYSCVGSYYTGGCAGSYGTCSGTPNCGVINDSTNCGFETGCTWSNNASINLPQGSTMIDGNNVSRVYKIVKARGSGNVVVNAYSGDSIANNGSTASSLTISTLYTGKEFQYRNITADCSTFNNNQSSCESNSCSWSSACAVWNNEGDCTGNGCSWDGMSCSGGSSGTCSGTYTVTKYWYVISSF